MPNMSGRVSCSLFLFIWCEVNFYFHVKVSNESPLPQQPRVYYIDQDFILREVISETGDSWQSGALSNKNWAVYVNSGLDALGEGRLPSGVRLRVVFHEATKFPQWSAADYTDSNGWTTKLFPPAK